MKLTETTLIAALVAVTLMGTATAFAVPSQSQVASLGAVAPTSSTSLFSTTTSEASSTAKGAGNESNEDDEDDDSKFTAKGLLKRDRYMATNRFAVRSGKGAKFEKRWATRKSKLATLDGFRYFHLMRRVQLNDDGSCAYDEGTDADSAQGNYVSFTIWEKKSHFSAWRKGEAFKEAHGGTSIGAFLSTMVNSAFILRGPPRPAFYDGLLMQSTAPNTSYDIVDGWRSVTADGVTNLPTECFVAQNQFFVPPENAPAFEQRWAQRESKLKDCDGFVTFSMLRRDGQAKGHGTVEMTNEEPTYLSTTIWKDRASFQAWREGTAFQQGHGDAKPPAEQATTKESAAKPPADAAGGPPQPLWTRPPKPVFYEGTLVITSEEGA